MSVVPGNLISLPARASDEGNVIGSVRRIYILYNIYLYICVQKKFETSSPRKQLAPVPAKTPVT